MEAKAIVAYVVCDEVVKKLEIQEDKQSKMSVAEIMTTGIIASLEYFGNIEKARRALWKEKYIPKQHYMCITNSYRESIILPGSIKRLCSRKRGTLPM